MTPTTGTNTAHDPVGSGVMNKIVFGLHYDLYDVVKDIIHDRESCEWVDSHGRTGGHPDTYVVTIGDVIERIEGQLREEMEAISSWDKEYWNFTITDETGVPIDPSKDNIRLTNSEGEFLV